MSTTDELLENKPVLRVGLPPRCPAEAVSEAFPMPASASRGSWGPTGDAHVVRNAGGVVRDDAIRLLVISRRLPGRGRSCSSPPRLRHATFGDDWAKAAS